MSIILKSMHRRNVGRDKEATVRIIRTSSSITEAATRLGMSEVGVTSWMGRNNVPRSELAKDQRRPGTSIRQQIRERRQGETNSAG